MIASRRAGSRVVPAAFDPGPAAAAVAALAAAFCWTSASLLWRRLPTSLSAARLNLLKNLLALALQLPVALLLPWPSPGESQLLLALSGVVGIALGDSLYFAALRRLGTRRTLTLEAGGPGLTALVGSVLLGEVPSLRQGTGIALISVAMVLAARERPPAGGEAPRTPGSRWWFPGGARGGLLLALAALFCGSAGALLSRAALRGGAVHPVAAATLRLGAAALVMLPLLRGVPAPGRRPRPAVRRWPRLLLATLLGTSAGIVLQQQALAGLPGGVAVALLATAPVMALPLARLEGDHPGPLGLLAALCALLGVSLLAVPLEWPWN